MHIILCTPKTKLKFMGEQKFHAKPLTLWTVEACAILEARAILEACTILEAHAML